MLQLPGGRGAGIAPPDVDCSLNLSSRNGVVITLRYRDDSGQETAGHWEGPLPRPFEPLRVM